MVSGPQEGPAAGARAEEPGGPDEALRVHPHVCVRAPRCGRGRVRQPRTLSLPREALTPPLPGPPRARRRGCKSTGHVQAPRAGRGGAHTHGQPSAPRGPTRDPTHSANWPMPQGKGNTYPSGEMP